MTRKMNAFLEKERETKLNESILLNPNIQNVTQKSSQRKKHFPQMGELNAEQVKCQTSSKDECESNQYFRMHFLGKKEKLN